MNKIKIFAMAVVAMMLLSGVMVMQGSQPSYAEEVDLQDDLQYMNPGSWTWNSRTGMGPFNSFYAAFDIDNDNAFYAILDPYDLSKTIAGEDLPENGLFNIMWVIPTVYLSETATSLTIKNDDFDAASYAHTIDGHTYNYLCLGVYEASVISVQGGGTYLASIPGVSPTANHMRSEFRSYAQNYTMSDTLNVDATHPAHSMLWNYDQWQLYRLLSFAVMEDANAQNIVGNGSVYASSAVTSKTTGLLDQAGPYAGNPGLITDATTAAEYGSNSTKLFIENAWGSLQEFVDGCVFVGRYTVYIDSSSAPEDATTAGGSVVKNDWTLQTGYPSSIQTVNARTWGFPGSVVNGSSSAGLTDYISPATSGSTTALVGGPVGANATDAVKAGISSIYTNYTLTHKAANMGTRLAFVCDSLPGPERDYEYIMNYDSSAMTTSSQVFSVDNMTPISHTFPADTYTMTIVAGEGGSVSTDTVTGVPAGSIITTDGASMTINGTTVTATASDPTEQYVFAFDRWDGVPAGGLVTSDLTIRAKFTESLQTYFVTWVIGEQQETEQYQYGAMPSRADPTPPEGQVFKGWVPTIVTVTGNATYTAQFEVPSDDDPTHALLKLVPFFIVIAMVMAAVGTALVAGTDPMTIAKLGIGLTIGVIMLATLVIPAIGGL